MAMISMKARKLPLVYTELQLAALVRAPNPHSATGLRDRAILATLCCTGIRASELCHLRVADLNLVEAHIVVRDGKNGDDRYVPLTQKTLAHIQAYRAQYRAADDAP